MRTTAELREGYLSFFEEKGHLRRPSASLIPPAGDHSTLLTSAGMQPQMPFFLGLEPPPAPTTTTSQKVFRTPDIDVVGLDTYHLTFFEMLGNFSFGQYFKEGAIAFATEFIQERLKLDWERIWVSVHAGDPELKLGPDQVAIDLWEQIGMPPERIIRLPSSENFWSVGGPGPCGPDSEIYYDWGAETGCGEADCAPGCTRCERFLEFWNLVFMAYELHADGTLTDLPAQNIDTGLGLERTARIVQDVGSVYDTDGFQQIMEWTAAESGVAYGDSADATKAHRVLADHGRGMTFLVSDGVTPSNDGRGYVLRRVIRRAVHQAHRIGLDRVYRLAGRRRGADGRRVSRAARERGRDRADRPRGGGAVPRDARARVEAVRRSAHGSCDHRRGGLHARDDLRLPGRAHRRARRGARPGGRRRRLHLAHGRASRDLARRRRQGRHAARRRVRPRRRLLDAVRRLREDRRPHAARRVEELGDGLFLAKLRESPFYPDGGGQVSDLGLIEHEGTGAKAELREAFRFDGDQALVFEGEGFAAGDRVRAVVPWSVRFPTMANHTATHLLQQALRDVLGDHVKQAGSAVRPDKLRFDFSHGAALTAEERVEVEKRVNEEIFRNAPVHIFETPIDEARKLGAMMLFGEKYGDIVRVVSIPEYSTELCGGTHVRTTAEIGAFAILSESSVGSGARRIEAVTSGEAYALLHGAAAEAAELRGELERVRKESRQKKAAPAAESEYVSYETESAGGVNVIVGQLAGVSADDLLELSDQLKQREQPAAVVLASAEDGRVHLVANFDKTLEARGLDAGKVIRAASAHVGGGGGGRPSMARAGGKDPEKLPDALATAKAMIVEALS